MLEIVAFWGEEPVDTCHVARCRPVTVDGRNGNRDLPIMGLFRRSDLEIEIPIRRRFEIARTHDRGATIFVPRGANLTVNGSRTPRLDPAAREGLAGTFELTREGSATLRIGTISFAIRFTEARAALSKVAGGDWIFPRIFAISMMIHLFLMVLAALTPNDDPPTLMRLKNRGTRFAPVPHQTAPTPRPRPEPVILPRRQKDRGSERKRSGPEPGRIGAFETFGAGELGVTCTPTCRARRALLGQRSRGYRAVRVGVVHDSFPNPYDREDIRRIIRKHHNRIRYCFEKELDARATSGKVSVTFALAADGRVKRARVRESTLARPRVGACMVEVVASLRFPPPGSDEEIVVNYPFFFHTT